MSPIWFWTGIWSREMSHLSKILFSYTTFSFFQNASFWCKPKYTWISGYRVIKDLSLLKPIYNKGIWTLFLPISQKQHGRHPTYSSWSCHTRLPLKCNELWCNNSHGLLRSVTERKQCQLDSGNAGVICTLRMYHVKLGLIIWGLIINKL